MSGHTPGPWKIDYKKFNIIKTADGAIVATCNNLTGLCNMQNNARLIAAAPDLLEVCQRLAHVSSFAVGEDVASIRMLALYAVEKATGGKA